MKTTKIFLPLFILSVLFSSISYGQNSDKMHTVFFFGNFADVENSNSFSLALKTKILSQKTPFTLVVNGDLVKKKINGYDDGQSLNKVYDLIKMMEGFSNGKLILVPGDRDWNNGSKGGEKSVKALESNIKKYLADNHFISFRLLKD